MRMEKYSEYQLTNIEWLPQIPKHWKLETLRKFIRMVSVKNHPEKPLLSVTREGGVIVRDVESKEKIIILYLKICLGINMLKLETFVLTK